MRGRSVCWAKFSTHQYSWSIRGGVGFEFFKNLGMGWGDGKVGTILGRPEAIGCHVTYTRAAAGHREEESTG